MSDYETDDGSIARHAFELEYRDYLPTPSPPHIPTDREITTAQQRESNILENPINQTKVNCDSRRLFISITN